MELNEPKSRRRKVRIKKSRFKAKGPGYLIRKLGSIFGSFYLENYRPINIGILLFLSLAAAFILMISTNPSTVNVKQAPAPAPVSLKQNF